VREAERSSRVSPPLGLARSRVVGIVAVLCILVGPMLVASAPPAGSQAAAAKVPAKVALTFAEFHGFTATADYLKKVAAAYPAVTEPIEIGRSPGNRPI
jgi:hypothetical protein